MSTYLDDYMHTLSGKAPGTQDAYRRAVTAFLTWLADQPGNEAPFDPAHLTRTAVETYMQHLSPYSPSHRTLVKAAISGFADWLIERGELVRNPTRGVHIPAQPLLAPRQLTPDQRYVLRNLVERAEDRRGAAIFALGYWAGCRVSDVAWLRLEDVTLRHRSGWITVGHKGGKQRTIDVVKAVRKPLGDYLDSLDRRQPDSSYVFTSQRAARLTEAGIHHWLRTLKARATRSEWELVQDVTFHDLRHDFAHRARVAGWTLEELAFYLGHVTRRGTPAVQTTVRYTQASRDQLRARLKLIEG
jgi:site-specific recombinase XerC